MCTIFKNCIVCVWVCEIMWERLSLDCDGPVGVYACCCTEPSPPAQMWRPRELQAPQLLRRKLDTHTHTQRETNTLAQYHKELWLRGSLWFAGSAPSTCSQARLPKAAPEPSEKGKITNNIYYKIPQERKQSWTLYSSGYQRGRGNKNRTPNRSGVEVSNDLSVAFPTPVLENPRVLHVVVFNH